MNPNHLTFSLQSRSATRFATYAVLFSFLILFSCRKDTLINSTKTIDGIPVEMQAWFEGKYGGDSVVTNEFAIYNPAPKVSSGPQTHFRFTPTWNRGKTSFKGDTTVVEVPVVNNDSVSFALNNPNGSGAILNRSSTRLLLLKEGSRKRSVFMTVVADDAYYQKDKKFEKVSLLEKDNDFNGVVLYHTMQGYFLNGFTYKDGKPLTRISIPGQIRPKKRSGKNASVSTDGCNTYPITISYRPLTCGDLEIAGYGCPNITVTAYYTICNNDTLNPDGDGGGGSGDPGTSTPDEDYNWYSGGFPWVNNPYTPNNGSGGEGGYPGGGPDDPCSGESGFNNEGSGSINVPCDGNGNPGPSQAVIRSYSVEVIKYIINETQNNFELNFDFSEAEKLELAEAIFNQNEGIIASNFSAVQSFGSVEDDPAIIAWLRGILRKAVGLDAPKDALEAAEIAALRSSLSTVATKVQQLHDNHMIAFGFVPGYAAFDNYVQGHDGYAAVNLSLDLFGGSLIKGIGRAGRSVIYVSDLTAHFPSIARSLKTAGVIDLRFVHFNNSQKYAIIGQTMDRVINSRNIINEAFGNWAVTFEASEAAKAGFNDAIATAAAQGRRLSQLEIMSTRIYAENQAWINLMKSEGYNFIDVGKNYWEPFRSTFYDMERKALYLH